MLTGLHTCVYYPYYCDVDLLGGARVLCKFTSRAVGLATARVASLEDALARWHGADGLGCRLRVGNRGRGRIRAAAAAQADSTSQETRWEARVALPRLATLFPSRVWHAPLAWRHLSPSPPAHPP